MDHNVAASAFVGSISGAIIGAAVLQMLGVSLAGRTESLPAPPPPSGSSSEKSCFPANARLLEGVKRRALPENSEVICLFDTETTIPNDHMIEFGAVLIHAKTFAPLARYGTLIHCTKITKKATDIHGITNEMVKNSPKFADVAQDIFDVLNGTIWMAHNVPFDKKMVDLEFQKLGLPSPAPLAVIDSLPLLRKVFGPRAGNLKMSSLARYFKLGEEQHRAVDDCVVTWEVARRVAVVTSLPSLLGGYLAESSSSPESSSSSGSSSSLLQQEDNILAIKSFLKTAKNEILLKKTSKNIIFVLGNEAMDLDSHVSSITFSFFLQFLSDKGEKSEFLVDGAGEGEGLVVVPLMNLERKDFVLRGDCVCLFGRVGLSSDDLLFLDDIDLFSYFPKETQNKLILTDYNKLEPRKQTLENHVIGIIDHHKDEGGHKSVTASRRIISMVASATTLVAELFLNSKVTSVLLNNSPKLREFLVGPIVVDSVNFDPQREKVTDKDVEVAGRVWGGGWSGEVKEELGALFDVLKKAKSDVGKLSKEDLLRRDYKEWEVEREGSPSLSLGISGVGSVSFQSFFTSSYQTPPPLPTDELANQASLSTNLEKFYEKKGLDVLVVMFSSVVEGKFRRELVLYCPNLEIYNSCKTKLEESSLSLSLTNSDKHWTAYDQEDVASSRKQVYPVLQTILSTLK